MEWTFGVEIEMVADLQSIAEAVASALSLPIRRNDEENYDVGGGPQRWQVTRDDSIEGAPPSQQAELVSPVMRWNSDDLASLISVVRAVREVAATVNDYCGLHVHVGIPPENDFLCVDMLFRVLRNNQDLLLNQVGVWTKRQEFTKTVPQEFWERFANLNRAMDRSIWLDGFQRAWYGGSIPNSFDRFHAARYYTLNPLPWFDGLENVEFRCYNSSLEERLVTSYITASVAMVQYAWALSSMELMMRGGETATSDC